MFVIISTTLVAQQDAQYTQYMYNTSTINPAYAGSRGLLSFTGLYRDQWVGLDGAPRTLNFTLNTPLTQRLGFGLSATSDEIGPSDETTVAVDLAYAIPLNEKDLKFAFGLKGGANFLNVNFDELTIFNPSDPQRNNIVNRITPIVGLGGYLYTDKWYFGVSTPNILKTNHYEDNVVADVTERLHFYGVAGYVFNISENLKFKPAALVKAVEGAPLAIDVTGNFLIKKFLTLGAAYRFGRICKWFSSFSNFGKHIIRICL